MNKPLDFTGREITVGVTLVYPVRRGSSMWLSKMNVTQVLPGETGGFKVLGYNNVGRKVTVQTIQNTVILDKRD